MKKLSYLVTTASLIATLVGACSASERKGLPNGGKAEEDAGVEDSGEQIFQDVAVQKDAVSIFEQTCAKAEAETSTDPVVLEFVLDGSGSMSSDNKWTAAVQALNAVFDEFLNKNDPNLVVGLIVFADSKDPTGDGPYPNNGIDVYPMLVTPSQHKLLTDRINTTSPSGGTPSYAALNGGITTMLNYVAAPPAPAADQSRKVVVFMSDGEPNGGDTEQLQCIDAAKKALAFPAPKGPIKTFSVGIGAFPGNSFGYDPKFMGDLAVAGGTRASPQCQPAATNLANVCHFQVTPGGKPVATIKQEMVNAINRIRGLAVGCEFKINFDEDAGAFDPDLINVFWTDGKGKKHLVPKDEVDGWTYDDEDNPTKVVLNGQSCGDVSQDLAAQVQILIGCATQIQ